MAVVGVTVDANLTARSVDLVYRKIVELLRPHLPDLIGMTCLARGADQTFADAVLALGGALQVVVPASNYFTSISNTAGRALRGISVRGRRLR